MSTEDQVLQLLLFNPPLFNTLRRGFYDARPLAWIDAPRSARWSDELEHLDLGDEECRPIPLFPEKEPPGLWVLRWRYRMGAGHHADRPTAFYADSCEWSRPTLDDLVAFGVLPAPLEANK